MSLPLTLPASIWVMPLAAFPAHLVVIAVLSSTGALDLPGPDGDAIVLIGFAVGSCALVRLIGTPPSR